MVVSVIVQEREVFLSTSGKNCSGKVFVEIVEFLATPGCNQINISCSGASEHTANLSHIHTAFHTHAGPLYTL